MRSARHGRPKVSSIQVAIGLMILLLALFVSLFGYFIAEGARQTQKQFEDRAAAVSQAVATDAFWIAELANQTLRRVDAALGSDMTGDAEVLRPALEGLSAVTEVYIIDANAQTIYATVPGAEEVSVADRDYFTAVRDGEPFFMSSLIVSRLTGEHIFVFSKRVVRNGQFAGAIMVSFSEDLLAELAATLQLEPGSTVSFVRDDGKLIGRYPPTDGPFDLSDRPLFTEFLPAQEQGTYTSAASPVDGIARVVGFRVVPGTRIVAVASVATSAGWAEFNNAIYTVMLIASPVLLGLVFGCLWIVHLLARDATRTRELEASNELNTMLLREIHHRIKNSLQSAISLVRMQDMPKAAKRDLEGRLIAMSAVHEHIYKHDVYAQVDAHDFVPAVVDQVKAAYGANVSITCHIEHLVLDRDRATPLALLLSELATNCFKHAFPDGGAGEMIIEMRASHDGRAHLTVRDNGLGHVAPQTGDASGMGTRLIEGVMTQLGGSHTYRNDGGTVFEAEISLAPETKPLPTPKDALAAPQSS